MIGYFSTVSFSSNFHFIHCSCTLVSAVCHHGGAGTTAAGLRAGKPTIIVPFFGDQFFWGSMISKSGAGPAPMPGKTVTAKQFAAAFEFVHKPEVKEAALKISTNFQKEKGCEVAIKCFHAHLPVSKMRSDLDPTFGACFQLNEYNLQISRPVAQVLIAAGVIEESDLSYHPVYAWHTLENSDPFESIARGFRRAVTRISDSVQRLKRSSSLNTEDTRAKRERIGIGRSFKDSLSLYGEIKEKSEEEQTENKESEERLKHSVYYGLATLITKPFAMDEQESTPTPSSPPKTNVKPRQNNRLPPPGKPSNQNRTNRNSNSTKNNKTPEQKAADMTGLSIEACEQILFKFKEVKDRHQQTAHARYRIRSRSTTVVQ